jgi:hypothetical protein
MEDFGERGRGHGDLAKVVEEGDLWQSKSDNDGLWVNV